MTQLLHGKSSTLFSAWRSRELRNNSTGYTTLTLERRAFLQTLYDQLRDKSKIIERSRVENIIEENEIVRVVLKDGTEHVGDLVVGSDGVHSKVRELMWRNANESIPGFISAAEKRCRRANNPSASSFKTRLTNCSLYSDGNNLQRSDSIRSHAGRLRKV